MKSLVVLLLASFAACAFAQPGANLADPVLLDPHVKVGKLNNGMTYYIRTNVRPEKRMELRLAVNAGSVLEDDDQQGLAHFAEHMAFNGSEHFHKQELVNYLESVGVRFGADLNAYTSFDETVYMLQLPTDTAWIMDKGFQVLEDWAHYVSYEDEEIDKERGVVIEEWRIGRGANARMNDMQFPIMFKGSKYAERLPIGKKPILESFKYDAVKRFYRDWYRPELMAVIAVGDFNADSIEKEIKRHFGSIPATKNGRERVIVTVPDANETRFAIATDPEAAASEVGIMFKQPKRIVTTVGDYRARLVQNLYDRMFSARLAELAEQADAPFISASSRRGRFVRNAEYYSLDATVKNGGMLRGFETLLTEASRVRKFGFTATELEREKAALQRSADQRYDERDKTDSRLLVNQLVQNFLAHEPAPGAEADRELYRALLAGISVGEINTLATTLITETNRVVTANAPRKQGVTVPTEAELQNVLTTVSTKPVTAYVDRVLNKPLVEKAPAPGTVTEETTVPELGLTVWKLSNGTRVVIKPTNFKNDEVMLSAVRPGGTSLASDADYLSADEAAAIVQQSGIGAFDLTTLKKALAGKVASVSPRINETSEGIAGFASPKDLKEMFELVYLHFTAPRTDSAEFRSLIEKARGMLQNRGSSPQSAFMDTLTVTMGSYHPRRQPFTEASLKNVDLDAAVKFYRERFADANGFTFVIVGNVTPEALKPFVETYIGGLPTRHQTSTWRDVGVHPPTGVIEKTVRKGIEPKSQVRMIFSGPFVWSAENRWKLQSLCTAVSIKLREQLREEKGGVYGVSASGAPSHMPRQEYTITVAFPCSPDRANELAALALAIIDSVKQDGVAGTYVQKVREQQLRDRETQIKTNAFWSSALLQFYYYDEDPRLLLKFNDMVNTLSPDIIRDAARTWFNTNNYVRVTLMPEK